MSMLERHRVSKVYGQGTAGVHALADVSLPVDEGSMVAVMGPGGSGKSTLLTIAGTLEEPTSGDGVPADQHPGGKPAVDPGGHADHRGAARLAAGRPRPGRHRPPATRMNACELAGAVEPAELDRFVAWRHLRGQLRGEHRQHRPRLPGQKAAGLLAAAAASHGQLGALAEIFRAAVSMLPSLPGGGPRAADRTRSVRLAR